MSEAYRSAQFKRGVVKENDPKSGRSRVEFQDEDGVQSFWLSWNMGAAGGSKMFNQPDLGSQVHCLIDRHGEDGCILGARYSAEDAPPTQNGQHMKAVMEGGLDFTYDKGAGSLVLKLPGGIVIEAATLTIKADIATEGKLTNNGHDISSTHKHTLVVPGGGQSGPPP